jgi:GWxTD domain-containing protein
MKKLLKATIFAFGMVICLLIIFVCQEISLPGKTMIPLQKWYSMHRIIMETKVPYDVDPKCPYEWKYFLRLAPNLQAKYMELFWKIRRMEQEEIFKQRIEFANKFYRDPGKSIFNSDRARFFIICGYPDEIQTDMGKNRREIWIYWLSTRAQGVVVTFLGNGMGDWVFDPLGAVNLSDIAYLLDYGQEWWSPIDWELWLQESGLIRE